VAARIRPNAAAVGGTALLPAPLGMEASATNTDIHAESSRRVAPWLGVLVFCCA